MAAERCDALVAQVADVLENTDWTGDHGLKFYREASPLLQQLSSESVFLPVALRQRVDEASLVIRQANDLDREHYNAQIGWAAHTARYEVHNAVAAWLRGEDSPQRGDSMCDFILAAELVEDSFEQMYQEQVGHNIDATQAEWRAGRAVTLAQIKRRSPGT